MLCVENEELLEWSFDCVIVFRHWQELGYLIIYITARPDMQQRRVVTWLAQHNFPHGMVAFMDGLSTDPLRQKANFLKQLVQEVSTLQTAYEVLCFSPLCPNIKSRVVELN